MTDESTIEDTPGELERLESIIDKAATLRAPPPEPEMADVRIHGTQEAIDKFMAAMAQAQLEFGPIRKTKTATVRTRDRTSYEYSWAPLSEVLDATRGALAKHGITIWQPWSGPTEQGKYRVTTWVRGHGACVEAMSEFKGGGDPQSIGGLITYTRRYALNAILSVDADADLDQGGVDESKQESARQQPPPMPETNKQGDRERPRQSSKPQQKAPERPQKRSDPPPKPSPRNGGPPPEKGGFGARVRQLKAQAPANSQDELPEAWQPPTEPDPRQAALPGSGLPNELPVEGDRPTAPVPEPPKAPKARGSSTLDPDKIAELERHMKTLGLKGATATDWVEQRINKRDLAAVTAEDLDFLLSAAREETAGVA